MKHQRLIIGLFLLLALIFTTGAHSHPASVLDAVYSVPEAVYSAPDTLYSARVVNATDYRQRGLGAIPSPSGETGTAQLRNLAQSQEFPSTYTWPALLPQALDQGAYSTCVADSLRAIKDMLALRDGNPDETHSTGFIYRNRGQVDWRGEGMVPSEALRQLKDEGTCLNSTFPQRGTYSDLGKYLTPAAHQEALNHRIASYVRLRTVDEVKTALLTTSPVSIMVPVYDSFYAGGDLQLPTNDESCYGYHQLTVVGWRENAHGEKGWWVLNSWGPDWSYGGYCWMPFDYPIMEYWAITDAVEPGTEPIEFNKPAFVEYAPLQLTVRAEAENVPNPTYEYWIKYPDGRWVSNGGYIAEDTYTFPLGEPGYYEIVIYTREYGAAQWSAYHAFKYNFEDRE